MHLGFATFPGLYISRHLSTPYCGIHIPLHATSLVVLVSNPVGSPFRFITISWKVHNGICFCFPGSFDVINHDITWITNHIRVRPNKVYIGFIILAIKFLHHNNVSMFLLPMVHFTFLGVLHFPSLFAGRATSSAL